MKYWLSGTNRETGAAMTMELDAPTKPDAERQAIELGMNVQRALEISSGLAAPAPARTGGISGASIVRVAILVIFFVMTWYYIVPRVRQLLGK